MMMGYFSPSSKISVLFRLKGKKHSPRENVNMKYSLLDDRAVMMNTVVPKGCVAVYVGADMRRFVIPTSYLCLPVFRPLMEMVAEEFGFDQAGGLRIPCEEEDFQALLKALEDSRPEKKKKKKTKTKTKNSMRRSCST